MSEPTYRVDLKHEPHDPDWPWSASVIRLSDEMPLTVKCGLDREEAFSKAQAAVVAMGYQQPSHSVYLSESGEILSDRNLHSVKS